MGNVEEGGETAEVGNVEEGGETAKVGKVEEEEVAVRNNVLEGVKLDLSSGQLVAATRLRGVRRRDSVDLQ